MNYPTRKVSGFELSDELRSLNTSGVDTPMLNNSNYTPDYVETRKDGTEVYDHAGMRIEVRAGEVIDGHGNVVNLRALNSQMPRIEHLETEDNSDDEYKDLTTIFPKE
jgi:hypothetical protein